jgi:hypothetical protein
VQGPPGAPGPQGPPGISGYEKVVAVETWPPEPGSTGTQTAQALCPSGNVVLGGGHQENHAINGPWIVDSYPRPGNDGWIITGGNDGGPDGTTSYQVTVYAICVSVAP